MEKIGYMGIAGSFSEVAARELMRQGDLSDAELIPMVCARNILEALRAGKADYGVLGVTNTTAGPVSEFVEAFDGVDYERVAECVLPIHHCIFVKPGVAPENVTQIASHPQAFRQTDHYREQHHPGWTEREVEDTALAAEWLAKGKLPETTAVICSLTAGLSWNLELLAENVEDSSENRTTFWLLKLTGT